MPALFIVCLYIYIYRLIDIHMSNHPCWKAPSKAWKCPLPLTYRSVVRARVFVRLAAQVIEGFSQYKDLAQVREVADKAFGRCFFAAFLRAPSVRCAKPPMRSRPVKI